MKLKLFCVKNGGHPLKINNSAEWRPCKSVKVIYVKWPLRIAIESTRQSLVQNTLMMTRMGIGLMIRLLWIRWATKRLLGSEFPSKEDVISAKNHWNIGDMGLEYRQKGNGLSPKSHRRFAEEAMAEWFRADLDSLLGIFRCRKVLKSWLHFVNYIPKNH